MHSGGIQFFIIFFIRDQSKPVHFIPRIQNITDSCYELTMFLCKMKESMHIRPWHVQFCSVSYVYRTVTILLDIFLFELLHECNMYNSTICKHHKILCIVFLTSSLTHTKTYFNLFTDLVHHTLQSDHLHNIVNATAL